MSRWTALFGSSPTCAAAHLTCHASELSGTSLGLLPNPWSPNFFPQWLRGTRRLLTDHQRFQSPKEALWLSGMRLPSPTEGSFALLWLGIIPLVWLSSCRRQVLTDEYSGKAGKQPELWGQTGASKEPASVQTLERLNEEQGASQRGENWTSAVLCPPLASVFPL